MKPFNLAQAKIAERQYCQRHVSRRLRAIAVLLVLTALVAAASCGCRIVVARLEADSALELANARERCAAIRRQMAAVHARTTRREWQKDLAGGSARWINVVECALDCLPDRVWLRRVETWPKESSLTAEGSAASFEVLTDLTRRLRLSSAFSDAQLASARVKRTPEGAWVDFVLTARLKVGAEAASEPPVQTAGRIPAVQESP